MRSANIPSGCADKEERISPCNKKLIAWPRPQPGQKLIPINLKKQKE